MIIKRLLDKRKRELAQFIIDTLESESEQYGTLYALSSVLEICYKIIDKK